MHTPIHEKKHAVECLYLDSGIIKQKFSPKGGFTLAEIKALNDSAYGMKTDPRIYMIAGTVTQ